MKRLLTTAALLLALASPAAASDDLLNVRRTVENVAYAGAMLHSVHCPKQRTEAFEAKRLLIMAERDAAGEPNVEQVDDAMTTIRHLIEQNGRGEYCRAMTAVIEAYQSRNEE
jgi:hypothetical protein